MIPKRSDGYTEDMMDLVQYAINRLDAHPDKPPLETLSHNEIATQIKSEGRETVDELFMQHSPQLYGVEPDTEKLKRECGDVLNTALMGFIYAKRGCP